MTFLPPTGAPDPLGSYKPQQIQESGQTQQRRKRRAALIAIATGVALVVGGGVGVFAVMSSQNNVSDSAQDAESTLPEPSTTPPTAATSSPDSSETSDPAAELPPVSAGASVDDPQSITVVINKQRPFSPLDWVPSDLAYPEIPNATGQPLRYEAAVALEKMYAEANAAGVPFALVSGFRDFGLQTTLFNDYVAGYGIESAETFSARPGYSEHQTGLVADISECLGCPLSEAFGVTPQGQWVRANAYRFGFILRYDQGAQPIVGYMYEPWHFRYVGVETAGDMHTRGITTLEEYFGLPAAPNY